MSTRIPAGVDDCSCFTTFIAMIPIDCKITFFSLTLIYIEIHNNYADVCYKKICVSIDTKLIKVMCQSTAFYCTIQLKYFMS